MKSTNHNRIRILYCDSNIDGTVGGAYYSLFYLVEGLDKTIYEPVVVFYRDNPLIPKYEELGIKVEIMTPPSPVHLNLFANSPIKLLTKSTRILQSGINFYRFFIVQAVKFASYLYRHNIKLVHLNNSVLRSHNWMLAARLVGARCVSHERGINTHFPNFARKFIKKLDGVICISGAVRDNMEKQGFSSNNLYTVYNGLDPARVQVVSTPEDIRSKYNIKNDVPVIGIVGNIKEWKGQEVVIRATAEIVKSTPSLCCLVVGDTAIGDKPYLDKLTKLVKSLGVEKNIIFTGYQANVPDFMNAMDIVIHASTLGEPFGRVLLEAMALSKPLIGARGGAVPEIIDEPTTGLMFEPGNSHDLAEAVARLLTDRPMANTMGCKGKERLNTKFHIDQNIERTQALYQELLDRVN